MLTVLRVKNFILMNELELTLEPGLNVLTGETGAGKSIVVGALALVLGGRASADQVRPGASEAEVEALFDLRVRDGVRSPALERLREAELLSAGELVIRRVISASGRSRAYLNGRLCTAAELVAIAPELADVASQHESVALTDPSTHLEHLDHFGKLMGARSELAALVIELDQLWSSVRELRAREKTRAERSAFLEFQRDGIDAVSPKGGELEELASERKRLRHAGKLIDLVRRSAQRLDGEGGLYDQLARVASDLREAAELDPSLEPATASVTLALGELRDAGATATRYAESTGVDPGRLEQVEERLYRLEGLLRQHGPTLDDVIAARGRLQTELDELAGAESAIAEVERTIAARMPAARKRALALSAARKQAAERLGDAISAELRGLGMGDARVLVEIDGLAAREGEGQLVVDGARLGRDGLDRVEFLISPNKGIEPRPLRKIASGGELSRALLALKRVLAEGGPAGLYVFDEVDAGVGGAVAERIGAAIADVAKHHQVLCITHLAPIAAFADAHYIVSKSTAGDMTESHVDPVRGEDRVREVARMLAGATVTKAAIEAARELILAAAQPKASGAKVEKVKPQRKMNRQDAKNAKE